MTNYSAIQDSNLSLSAKGLYAVVKSFIGIDKWCELDRDNLLSCFSNGSGSYLNAWNELKIMGYIKQKRVKANIGSKYLYKLCSIADLETEYSVYEETEQ